MRYIDRTQLLLPDGWLGRAQAASQAVAAGADPSAYGNVWRELKNGLADLFNDKCWYCEVSVPRSDNAVDHFRPKGRVGDAANPHPGYRWLAFEQSNFRYACTYCNCKRKDIDGGTAGGKGDRFPLVDETTRVYVPGPLGGERPALLDPCAYGDWKLLGCQKENGKPCAASDHPEHKIRADISIDVYHLHHEPTCKQRHSAAVQMLSDVEEAKGFFIASQSDPSHEVSFKNAAMRILKTIHFTKPFSGEMRFLLGGERDNEHPWVQELLET